MEDKPNEGGFEERVGMSADIAATAAHKINALLDLLEQKEIINPDEAKRIRDAKAY
jgi:predicted transcriptional regulator